MKTAEQWIEEYKNDKSQGNGLKRNVAWTTGDLCRAIQLDARAELLAELEQVKREREEAIDWLNTLLDRVIERADGAPDATPIDKFCNEMCALSNGVYLKDVMTLRQDRDHWKALAGELIDYTRHKCTRWHSNTPCTCGLTETLKELAALEVERRG